MAGLAMSSLKAIYIFSFDAVIRFLCAFWLLFSGYLKQSKIQ